MKSGFLSWTLAALVPFTSGPAAAQEPVAQTVDAPLFAGTPAEQLAAARERLARLGTYRERRDYTLPRRTTQIVEFAQDLQRWINEFRTEDGVGRLETIWQGGNSARRELPEEPAWECYPPMDERFLQPDAAVRDGGPVTVNGRAARRLVEEFVNAVANTRKVHETDIDAITGIPIRITSTEGEGPQKTVYVGTYYDLGRPITIEFPAECR